MPSTNVLTADTAPQERLPVDTLEIPRIPPAIRPAPPRAGRARWTAAVTVVAAAAVLGGAAAMAGRPALEALHRPSHPARAALGAPAVTSYDPAGGSGLRRDGASWTSQHYRTADFGGLKAGVGLLLDLPAARRLSAVTLSATPGTSLELRSADDGRPGPVLARSGGGAVSFDASGAAAHRRWLVFVTRLASEGGGYAVTLSNPTVIAAS